MSEQAKSGLSARPLYGSECGHPQSPPTDAEIEGCPEIIVRNCPICVRELWWNVDQWRLITRAR